MAGIPGQTPTHVPSWSNETVAEAQVAMLVSRLTACGSLQLSEPENLEQLQELGRGSFGVATLCRLRENGGHIVLKRIPLNKLDARGAVQLVSEVREWNG